MKIGPDRSARPEEEEASEGDGAPHQEQLKQAVKHPAAERATSQPRRQRQWQWQWQQQHQKHQREESGRSYDGGDERTSDASVGFAATAGASSADAAAPIASEAPGAATQRAQSLLRIEALRERVRTAVASLPSLRARLALTLARVASCRFLVTVTHDVHHQLTIEARKLRYECAGVVEQLTKVLLELDEVLALGDEAVHLARRQAVLRAQQAISRAEEALSEAQAVVALNDKMNVVTERAGALGQGAESAAAAAAVDAADALADEVPELDSGNETDSEPLSAEPGLQRSNSEAPSAEQPTDTALPGLARSRGGQRPASAALPAPPTQSAAHSAKRGPRRIPVRFGPDYEAEAVPVHRVPPPAAQRPVLQLSPIESVPLFQQQPLHQPQRTRAQGREHDPTRVPRPTPASQTPPPQHLTKRAKATAAPPRRVPAGPAGPAFPAAAAAPLLPAAGARTVSLPLPSLPQWTPQHRAHRLAEAMEVEVPLPGVPLGNVSVTCDGGVLRIAGVRQPTVEDLTRFRATGRANFGRFDLRLRVDGSALDWRRSSVSKQGDSLVVVMPWLPAPAAPLGGWPFSSPLAAFGLL